MANTATLEFNIESLEIKKIKKGENKDQKYLEMTLIENDPMAERAHKQCIFVPQSRIPMWEKLKADNDLPTVRGRYEIVEKLPHYSRKDDDDNAIGNVKTSMRVFVRCDSTGTPVEDPRNVALRIIDQLMVKVTMPAAEEE